MKTLGLSLFFVASSCWALPSYQAPEMQVRAHYRNAYNLPPLTYLSNTSPSINNHGDVTFKLMAVDGTPNQAVWYKARNESKWQVVYVAPEDRYVSDPTVNDRGEITFSPYTEVMSDGLFVFDTKSGTTVEKLSGPANKMVFMAYVQTLNDGTSVFRGMDTEFERGFYEVNGGLKTVAREGQKNFEVPSAYLFKPAVNDKKHWAFKVRVGERGEIGNEQSDQILLVKPTPQGYDKIIVAQDNKGDVNSPFTGFGNGVTMAQNGLVAFVGYDKNNAKSLILWENGSQTALVSEGQNGISELELFSPKVNSNGVVAFRAKNEKGLRGIYVASKDGIKRLIGEGDSIPTDLGPGQILQRKDFPGFAGDIDINEKNEVVFACVVATTDNQITGDAVYRISPAGL